MSGNYDPCSIYTVTADSDGTSNNLIGSTTSNRSHVLIHKVVLTNTTNGSNAVSVAINDDPSVGTSGLMLTLSTSSRGGATVDAYERYVSESFDPPLRFTRGVSFDVTGNGVSARIYYTRS